MTYPTEKAIASKRPLVRINDERAMIPAANSLYTAILESGEDFLSSSSIRERYFKLRDRALESEAAAQFRRLVSPTARIYESVFDRDDSTGEHDCIVIDGEVVFIVEAKASPPTEPFRDPDKAFTRLRRAFRAETGIQKGFEQAEAIRARLERGEHVPLFDERGRQLELLDPAVLRYRYSVVVTRDDFGLIATDLALLLEKPLEVPYPWVVNVLDLSAMGDAWEYLEWGAAELRSYLQYRLAAHGKAMASDELELVGYHIQHGSLQSLIESDADRVMLNPHYSDFFDALYQHRAYGTPMPVLSTKLPVLTDLRSTLAEEGGSVFGLTVGKQSPKPKTSSPESVERMKGSERNLRCKCGSGKKYKRCCGRSNSAN
jgi:hypothetical protein